MAIGNGFLIAWQLENRSDAVTNSIKITKIGRKAETRFRSPVVKNGNWAQHRVATMNRNCQVQAFYSRSSSFSPVKLRLPIGSSHRKILLDVYDVAPGRASGKRRAIISSRAAPEHTSRKLLDCSQCYARTWQWICQRLLVMTRINCVLLAFSFFSSLFVLV